MIAFDPHHRRNGRRGVTLMVMLVLIPAALAGLLLVFTHLEIQLREAARWEGRIQARHLAESALLEWTTQTSSFASAPETTDDGAWRLRLERMLSPQNTYRVFEQTESANGVRPVAVRCEGVAAALKADKAAPHIVCQIIARIAEETGTPEILSIRYQRR
ncbi:hypothetical protein JXA32_07820 [Candidatus Sumerlaeota bacterium]|nr:hypothetical protein [Candidatus Sumerlaeota bacterium]